MKCSKCSASIPENGIFCPQCGEKAQVGTQPSPVLPVAVVAPPIPATAPEPTKQELRRQKRREKRRRARGFWYNPVTNLICLVLCVSGWFFIPHEITVYISNYDFGQILANATQLFGFFSGRDIAATAIDALIAIGLIVLLILASILGLTAVYRIIKRLIVFSGSKRKMKKQQDKEIQEAAKAKAKESAK